jgi:adenine C2-methylase RlmN of 23S rRNA A2503 and tRNA A37
MATSPTFPLTFKGMPAEDSGMDVYLTDDNSVAKYIHADGSETAIKQVKCTQNVLNPITQQIEVRTSDRNKYSVFISSSVGCYMKCPFCHLTLKNSRYQKLRAAEILENLKEALQDKAARSPEIREQYIKLSWMGMGDAINVPDLVKDVTLEFLEWVLANNLAKGLDGVDLSTVLPPVSPRWIPIFQALNTELGVFPKNPVYAMDNVAGTTGAYSHRNPFRLFYSIHSAIQAKRDVTVPNAMPLASAVEQLTEYAKDGEHTVILHHLFVDGLNDSEEELSALIGLINTHFKKNELRVLRYNFCAKSVLKESDSLLAQVRTLAEEIQFLKVQVSPGSEVSAACGQFVVKDFVRIRKS